MTDAPIKQLNVEAEIQDATREEKRDGTQYVELTEVSVHPCMTHWTRKHRAAVRRHFWRPSSITTVFHNIVIEHKSRVVSLHSPRFIAFILHRTTKTVFLLQWNLISFECHQHVQSGGDSTVGPPWQGNEKEATEFPTRERSQVGQTFQKVYDQKVVVVPGDRTKTKTIYC
jgi:hypothetical protein